MKKPNLNQVRLCEKKYTIIKRIIKIILFQGGLLNEIVKEIQNKLLGSSSEINVYTGVI